MLLKQSMAALPALAFGIAASSLTATIGLADTIRLENGDTLSGHVKSLDDQNLVLASDVLGDVTLKRTKVAEIYLGDNRPQEPVATVVPAPPKQDATANKAGGVAGALGLGQGTLPAQQNLNDILGQLQSGGVSADTMEGLQQQFPLLADPKVSSMFRDRVGGLMSGRLDVQDIRKDAVQALDMIEELEADLGPQAAQALQGYKGILQNFVQRSAPVEPIKPEDESKNDETE
ncbi:hypothetical protein [Stratiformator vulcanicus]|uniref:Uncharacterized protein n=1 Tax=Stratiformator vulcanicus TaxID=2527980 RepID=A0A517QWG4_9PLAN|nr:hypothetical protein [Stratiformator vulcanicus]QDT35944.1 hypothetical protein Pan189_02970 [Stratiformator vulcanicus]